MYRYVYIFIYAHIYILYYIHIHICTNIFIKYIHIHTHIYSYIHHIFIFIIVTTGLPDRDYYFDADKQEKREKYITYIATLLNTFALAATSTTSSSTTTTSSSIESNQSTTNAIFSDYLDINECKKIAENIFLFEKSLASSHWTRTEMRDPDRVYNIFQSISTLSTYTQPEITKGDYLTRGKTKPNFPWHEYFQNMMSVSDTSISGTSAVSDTSAIENKLGYFNVYNPQNLKIMTQLLDSSVLPHYILFHIINSCADMLSQQFIELEFNFYQKELQGTAEMKPRWKRALGR